MKGKELKYFKLLCICLAWCLSKNTYARQSSLPVVHLQYTTLSKDTFTNGHIRLIEDQDTLSIACQVRHRGAYSTRYAKKSYAVKLIDSIGQKTDTSFLDMRSDNYWILDAMANDKARMRNRVAMDLWLDCSAKPYYAPQEPKMCNGYHGQFVEVYVNDAYEGIYCLTERVDRKQLKLKKAKSDTIKGVLYKSVNWKGSFFGQISPYNNTSETWMRYEYKYPDTEDSLITWEPLYETMYFVNTANAEQFANQAAYRLDIPVLMDFYLFTTLLSARDNCGRNLYLSYYNINQNSKLLITPWDIDHSFGRTYNASEEPANTPCWTTNNTIFQRFENDLPRYTDQLLERYAALRKTWWTPDSLKQRFTNYFNLFEQTNAAQREIERWSGVDDIVLDFDAEEQYIHAWLDERISYTDSLFQYSDLPTTSITPQQVPTNQKILHNGQLLILRDGKIYTLTGQELK